METEGNDVHITPEAALTNQGVLVTFNTNHNTLLGSILLPGKNTRALTQGEISDAWNLFVQYSLDPPSLPDNLSRIMTMYQLERKKGFKHDQLTWKCTFVQPGNPWEIKLIRNK